MYILLAANDAGDEVAFGPFTDEAAARSAQDQLRDVIDVFGPATYRIMQLATLPHTSPREAVVRPSWPPIVASPIVHPSWPLWCYICNMVHSYPTAVSWNSSVAQTTIQTI